MFDATRWDPDWREEEMLENVSLSEAYAFVTASGYEDGQITTMMDNDIFVNGELTMSWAEAEKLGRLDDEKYAEQMAALAAKREAERAEKKRLAAEEAATVGDAIDEENITFVMAVAMKYPAKDFGARWTAEEVGRYSGWRDKRTSWKATESDVIDTTNDREYHILMWRGQRTVTRTRRYH